jgi:hypothetical protein
MIVLDRKVLDILYTGKYSLQMNDPYGIYPYLIKAVAQLISKEDTSRLLPKRAEISVYLNKSTNEK